jgi:hypothetical protein
LSEFFQRYSLVARRKSIRTKPTNHFAAERSFFGVLQKAIGPEFTLLSKVRLADILQVQRHPSTQRRSAAFNRISSKHADFVLCDAKTFRVVAVIELDDKSHREKTRQHRDQFLDAALGTVGIPVLHVPAQQSYSIADLRYQLQSFSSDALAANTRNA